MNDNAEAVKLDNNEQRNNIKEKLQLKYKKFLKNMKLDKNKGIKLLILVICFCILILILCSNTTKETKTTLTTSTSYYQTSLEYARSIESKLENLIGKIKGVGDVTVMVYLDSSPVLVLAESTDEKVNTSSTSSGSTSYTTTVTEPIIITTSGTSTPLVLTEKLPNIQGVVVVAEGAEDIGVKLNISQAIKTLIDISSVNIQVFAS